MQFLNMADTMFEVTQILATRKDSENDEWVLVQWGCTWVLRSALEEGHLLTEYLAKEKLVQRVHVPVEAGTQTELDAAVLKRRRDKQQNVRGSEE